LILRELGERGFDCERLCGYGFPGINSYFVRVPDYSLNIGWVNLAQRSHILFGYYNQPLKGRGSHRVKLRQSDFYRETIRAAESLIQYLEVIPEPFYYLIPMDQSGPGKKGCETIEIISCHYIRAAKGGKNGLCHQDHDTVPLLLPEAISYQGKVVQPDDDQHSAFLGFLSQVQLMAGQGEKGAAIVQAGQVVHQRKAPVLVEHFLMGFPVKDPQHE
jgi:hypothetical protein